MDKSIYWICIAAIVVGVIVGVIVIYAIFPPCKDCPGTPTPTPTPAVTATPTAQPTPTTEPTPTPQALLWDSRLDALNVKVERVAGARFRLTKVWMTENGQWAGVPDWAWYYVDKIDGAGGETHAFAGVYDLQGAPIVGKNAVLYWPDGNDARLTAGDGWVNWFVNAKYYPDQGQTGPYWFAPLKGDVLRGAGLPYGRHVSLFGVWEEQTLLERVRSVFTP